MNLPESYLKTMKDMLGSEYDAYLESFNDKRLYGLRVNNLKISTEDFLKISPFRLPTDGSAECPFVRPPGRCRFSDRTPRAS